MEEHRVLVVADDLTGAMDAASRFSGRGFETSVAVASGGIEDAAVAVVDTDSRYVTATVASERVRSTIESHPAEIVYKKIDSTLRGNVVPEVETALSATESDGAVVAPAFPGQDRITIGGRQLLDRRPVTETGTGTGTDPERAARTSHLPTLFEAMDATVVAVPVEQITSTEGLRRSFAEALAGADRPVVFVCDATTGAHLARIADAAGAVDASLVYVGSAGLAGYVGTRPGGGALGVVGSTNERTLRQLGAIPDDRVVALDPEETVTSPADAVDAAATRLVEVLATNRIGVVTAARARSDVEATLRAGRGLGHGEAEIRDRVADVLGRVADQVATRTTVGGLFVTGGTVARRSLDALGASSISIGERTIAPGIPVGRIRGGRLDDVPVVTKAGGFGDPELIFNSLDHLSRRDD